MIKVTRIDHKKRNAAPDKDFEIEQRRLRDGNAMVWGLNRSEAWTMVTSLIAFLAEDDR
jgi:hypothetical protein